MDKKTTVAKIRELVRKTREARGWNPSAKEIAISLVLEASELLEHFQWEDWEELLNDKRSGSKKREEIEMEVADVVFYLCEFADRMNIDLSKALKEKLKKVDKKYPAKLVRKGGRNYYYKQKKRYRKAK